MRVFVTLCLFIFSCNISSTSNFVIQSAYENISKNPSKSIELATEAIIDRSVSDYEKSQAYFIRAYLQEKKDIESALWDYLESYRFIELSGRKDNDAKYRKSYLLNNIGKIYHKFEQYDKAFDYYNKALDLVDEDGKLSVLFNLGLVTSKLRNYEVSNDYLNKALEISDLNHVLKNKIYTELALNLSNLGDLKGSLKILNSLALNTSFTEEIRASSFHNLSVVYFNHGDTSNAITSLNKAISLDPNKRSLFASLNELTELYYLSGWFPQTIATGALAERLYGEVNIAPTNFEFLKFIAKAHVANNDSKLADKYWQRYSDELTKFNNIKSSTEAGIEDKIALLTTRYENEARLRNQKLTIIKFTVALIVLIVMIIYLGKKYSFIHFSAPNLSKILKD